ncbi:MAG: hypothetical protein RMK84_11670 [Oscillochloridaceae bacterium]|nr:hypothetical protein [Chloroflexaceae bacterium]MDW8390774.1 hypothetical protein [Oscillochloridaceae bacterium]
MALQFALLAARAAGGFAREAPTRGVHLNQTAPAVKESVGTAAGISTGVKLAPIKKRLVRVAAAHTLQPGFDKGRHRVISARMKNRVRIDSNTATEILDE